tara:strand:+ start:2096 stop:2368 length:273 start_codon:yes stop_codon:yes gene_type:complete
MRTKLKVRNMQSKNYNLVPNQFEIYLNNKRYFQSYDTIICYYDNKGLVLDTYATEYSRTTSKYLTLFTGMYTKELRQKIKDKTIRVKNLN